jgi:phosphoglucosamine mutase
LARLFGTDGVRGLANRDLTAEVAVDLAVAAAHVLGDIGVFEGHRPTAVVGRDGRASGEFLEAAVVAGLASAGVDVALVGVLPTPGVAFLTEALNADVGVMLSASHNPMPDNGIKFFARGGVKLDDVIEDAIEARLREPWDRPIGAAVGRVHSSLDSSQMYEHHLLASLTHRLDGLTIVVDCANGAASAIGPEIYAKAGATVIPIHSSPDGLNINDGCGSTHMEDLVEAVLKHGADAGIAHDGDADRCLAVDATGALIDGDHILAILAMSMKNKGALPHDTVVATVMANLGFKLAMEAAGITVIETGVGDRYVLEAMRAGGYALGGEQSGHVVMTDYATTGHDHVPALLADLAAQVTKFPQVLINVSGVDRTGVDSSVAVGAAVLAAQSELGNRGRVLLRASGTEPVIRVMVEAATHDQAAQVAGSLAEVVRSSLALS